MSDNSAERLHDVFFYGLYMDPEILQSKGVEPRDPRPASVQGYQLKIGNKATLLRNPGQTAHGMLYSLTHAEIHSLYWGAGLTEYAAEAVLANDGSHDLAALCCNLINPPQANEANPDYASKLKDVMSRLGLPTDWATN